MKEDFPRLRVPREFSNLYPPDREGLFDLLRSLVTEEMLLVIARCDYENDVDEHLAALKKIREGLELDHPLQWHPIEVLNLKRWSTPEHDHNFRDAVSFHIMRAFCTATLRRIPDVHQNTSLFEPNTLAPLIQSCEVLGSPFRESLLRQIVWSLEEMELDDVDYLFNAFGVLVAYVLQGPAEPSVVESLSRWMTYANEALLPVHELDSETSTFLDIPFTLARPEPWRLFAKELMTKLPENSPGQVLLARDYG